MRRPQPKTSVIDELDVVCEQRVAVTEVEAEERRDQTRRRRGALALGAVGEELGVALVQTRDGVAQAVGSEVFAAPPPSLLVDLEKREDLDLVGADVELLAGCPARRNPLVVERERVTEG